MSEENLAQSRFFIEGTRDEVLARCHDAADRMGLIPQSESDGYLEFDLPRTVQALPTGMCFRVWVSEVESLIQVAYAVAAKYKGIATTSVGKMALSSTAEKHISQFQEYFADPSLNSVAAGVVRAVGYNGQVTVENDMLTISRKGMMATLVQGGKGDKRIPLRSITAVQLRKPLAGTDGYIQFSILGAVDSGGGFMRARGNENSISFYGSQLPAFEKVQQVVEEFIRTGGQTQQPVVQAAAPQVDVADQLAKFADLRDKGILTEDEFQEQKRKLLSM